MIETDEIEDIRRPVLRSLWFQVHKWIGISLAILLIPLSLTGSILVWHDPLDEMLNPSHFAPSGPAQLPPSHYVAAAREALAANALITSLSLPSNRPVQAMAVDPARDKGRAGPLARTTVWLDPVTARVIDVAPAMTGIIRFAHDFHGSLLVPGNGRTIVGVLGLAMLLSSLTGLWLWWPRVGGFLRGLRWRRHRHLDGNLHHQLGFWIALPLAVLSLTGVFISFPSILGAIAGAPAGQGGPAGGGAARARAVPLAETRLTVDQSVAAALPLARGAPAMITWPTDRQPAWRIAFGGGGQRTTVAVDDETGVASQARPESRRPGANGLARSIHDGDDMPFVWQLIIFLAGLIPAVLGVTGIIMWLRMRRVRARAARAAG